ncbi:hypothetical protein EMIT0P291_110234 [Pseudomonas sp. IT-P291]
MLNNLSVHTARPFQSGTFNLSAMLCVPGSISALAWLIRGRTANFFIYILSLQQFINLQDYIHYCCITTYPILALP